MEMLGTDPSDVTMTSCDLTYDAWYEILKYIGPKEIRGVWPVSDLFRDILRERYIQTSLPEIVRLIQDKRPKYLLLDTDAIPGRSEWSEYEKSIIAKRHGKIFLDLRLLSKLTKACVEDIFYSSGRVAYSRRRGEMRWVENIEELDKMTANIKLPSFNPNTFFPGSLVINGSWNEEIDYDSDGEGEGQENLPQFHQAIIDFLMLVGHRIRFFTYKTYLAEAGQIYNLVRGWAGLMPNLEYLCIHTMSCEAFGIWTTDDEQVQQFPSCPLLTHFSECIRPLPAAYVHRILEANPSISNLKTYEQTRVLDTLVNITKLEIAPTASLFQHVHLPWKLKSLVLGTYIGINVNHFNKPLFKISSSLAFPFLKQFEETLEDLDMRIFVTNSGGDDGSNLQLGNLKNVKWNLHKSFGNVNFLLLAKKLETIHIRYWNESKSKGNSGIKKDFHRIFVDNIGGFKKGSVWVSLPYLERIELVTHYDYLGGKGPTYMELRNNK